MTKREADELIKTISQQHKVVVVYEKKFQKDYGECYPEIDKILLGVKYSSGKIKLAVFLHELAHVLTIRRTGHRYIAASIFQEETAVWTLAQELHLKYTDKPFSVSQGKFMIKCLETYSKHHYCFNKKYNKKKLSIDEPIRL